MEKNQGGFTVSEPCCERAFPLKGKEILLQSVSLLTPVRNRRIHAPLTHPLPFTFLCCSSSALPLNLLVMMQLIESGERRGRKTVSGKKVKRKKGIRPVPRASGNSQTVENVCSSSLHPSPESTVSRKRRGYAHTVF